MSDRSLRYGLAGGSRDARQRQMDADDRALREQDARTEQGWRKKMAKKVKQTKGGPVTRPPTTDKAQANLDTLGELLGDVADAIREADAREQVVQRANEGQADPRRFPSIKGGQR
ncbi:hypothetical protein [Nocardioides mangrovi]|uniref:Uncharacterized protein n=1 Tax=Nocardioides mangrovi TaxID=2874580 RepID=A0ABS7UG48_9ACTN|nr:hypothetical protein [Nocardioides mangrovi]MBZ5739775.1 hypothetical protein [Nocardioides mangrovi]